VTVYESSDPKAIIHLQLRKDRSKVVPHGGFCDTQLQSDLLVFQAAAHQRKELTLSMGQPLDAVWL
jgi:hypothetical protein